MFKELYFFIEYILLVAQLIFGISNYMYIKGDIHNEGWKREGDIKMKRIAIFLLLFLKNLTCCMETKNKQNN